TSVPCPVLSRSTPRIRACGTSTVSPRDTFAKSATTSDRLRGPISSASRPVPEARQHRHALAPTAGLALALPAGAALLGALTVALARNGAGSRPLLAGL